MFFAFLVLRHRRLVASERGTSLVTYSLVLALVTVSSLGAVDALLASSSSLLEDSGDDIGTPRSYRNDAVLEANAPPAWASTTLPPTLVTFVEKPIQTAGGCLAVSGTTIGQVPCGDPAETLFSGLSEDATLITLSTADATVCVHGDPAGVPDTVTMIPCTGLLPEWEQIAAEGVAVMYRHQASGLCLTGVATGAPVPPPAALVLATCDESPQQVMTLVYGG
ncbi:MAG: hypothetical protein AAF467_02375 [Actinomycetota bacterium]